MKTTEQRRARQVRRLSQCEPREVILSRKVSESRFVMMTVDRGSPDAYRIVTADLPDVTHEDHRTLFHSEAARELYADLSAGLTETWGV